MSYEPLPFQTMDTAFGPVSFRRLGSGQRKILFFHGFPGSSSQIGIFRPLVEALDLEVYCFDRPGYHQTKIKTTDPLSVTLAIADELIRFLNWSLFEVITVSGGTPFGISYSLKNQSRVKSIRVICGLGNLHASEVKKYFPATSYLALKLLPFLPGSLIRKLLFPKAQINFKKRNPLLSFFLPASTPDLKIFEETNVLSSLEQSLKEALQQDALGPKQDALVFVKDWMDMANSKLPYSLPIHFWHGEQDHVISYRMAQQMALLFANGAATILKNEGHISLPVKYIKQILDYRFDTA